MPPNFLEIFRWQDGNRTVRVGKIAEGERLLIFKKLVMVSMIGEVRGKSATEKSDRNGDQKSPAKGLGVAGHPPSGNPSS